MDVCYTLAAVFAGSKGSLTFLGRPRGRFASAVGGLLINSSTFREGFESLFLWSCWTALTMADRVKR